MDMIENDCGSAFALIGTDISSGKTCCENDMNNQRHHNQHQRYTACNNHLWKSPCCPSVFNFYYNSATLTTTTCSSRQRIKRIRTTSCHTARTIGPIMTVMGWALTMILLSLSSWNRGGAHAFSSSRWVFLPAQQQQQRRGWRSVSSNSDLLLFRHPKSSSLATRSTTTTNHDPNENSSTPPSSSIHETSSSSSSVTAPPHLTAANAPPFRVTIEDEDYSYGDAVRRTLAWVGAAILFGSTLWATAGTTTGEEFFAGYLVEQSLSVDNLFVFLLLFEYFKVPLQYQDRVLNWGIYGAIIMRAIMIGLGAVALQQFHAILLVFAAILVYSSAKFFVGIVGGDDEEDEDDPANNAIVQFSKTLVHTSDHYDGDRFFTVVEGVRKATPLFLCMVAVEISDVVFAVDSIPAVFGVTENPLVVFSSNIFAIMGLRSLYTILSKAATDLKYLEPAVAIVLGFIGGKMIAEYCGYDIPTNLALGVVMTTLGSGIGLSVLEKQDVQREQQILDKPEDETPIA